MDIEKLIKSNLKIPVIDGFAPIHPPCITCSIISENSVLDGNGESTEETESYQIDVWCKKEKDVHTLTRKLKLLVQSIKGTTIPTVSYYYDNNGQTWRGNLMFECLREE